MKTHLQTNKLCVALCSSDLLWNVIKSYSIIFCYKPKFIAIQGYNGNIFIDRCKEEKTNPGANGKFNGVELMKVNGHRLGSN